MLRKLPTGFTVAELMIVSAIFVILFAVSIANYRDAAKTETMRLAGQQLTADISWLQTAAITGTSADAGMGYGYGIALFKNTNSYSVFRDNNNSKFYESNVDDLIKTVTLANDFIFSQLKSGGVDTQSSDIVFYPPKPTMYVNNELSKTVYVRINRSAGGDKAVVVELEPITGRATQNFVPNY